MSEQKRKCLKCGATGSEDPKILLYRFPRPGVTNTIKCELWAKYCFPDGTQSASPTFQKKLYSEHRMLCSRHFKRSAFIDIETKKLHKHEAPKEESTMGNLVKVSRANMPPCAVLKCKNTVEKVKKKDGISYFRFPREEPRREKWRLVIATNRHDEYFKPSDSTVVCSNHFLETDFFYTPKGYRRLKKDAYPRVKLSDDDGPTEAKRKRRMCEQPIDCDAASGSNSHSQYSALRAAPITSKEVPVLDDVGEEEYLDTDELADDGDDVDDRCPSPEVVEKKPPKVLPVLCGKCTRLIEDHLFVCASCSDSEYEPLCASCAEHQDAHATCYVLRANVTRPKTEIHGVLCAIRSELAMKSFADELDDVEDEIKSEVDVPEDVLDVDPFDEIDSAFALNEAPTTSAVSDNEGSSEDGSTVASELPSNAVVENIDREGILDTEDESDNENINLPQPTSMQLMQRQSTSEQAALTTTLKTSNIIKIVTYKDSETKLQVSPLTPRGTPLTASIKADNKQITEAKAGPSGLKRYQDDDQHSDIKKAKLNIPQIATQVKILPKGAQLLPKGAQLLPKGLKILPKGQMLLPKGQMLPPGAKVTPKGFILTQKGTMLHDDYKKLTESVKVVLKGVPVPVKSVLRKCDDAPKTSQIVTEPSGSGMDPERSKQLQVVLKDLNLPPNMKTVKIVKRKKPN